METTMRITDDRYTRDRLRFDLALRLIRHEARTCTIRRWTGLTDDRIRKLYKSYIEHSGDCTLRRHRGKSPRQPAYFTRNPEIRLQTASLASFLCQLGLLQPAEAGAPGDLGRLRWGERFCEAYEGFVQQHRRPQIGFEHACFLQRALERQRELCIDDCAECGALLVLPAFAARPADCSFCSDGGRRAAAR
jgi:hypothetical protein